MKPALTLEEAQERVIALARPARSIDVNLNQSLGRYLAADLSSNRTQPCADLSAMDGYAIGAARPDSNAWTLVGESRAGAPFDGVVRAGETIRISTGAHVPAGADRILLQENAERDGQNVRLVSDYPEAALHIRQRGFDFEQGDLLILKGTLINAVHIALAASAGHSTLPIAQPPRVAILDSGDELVADPSSATEHQLPASNGLMLEAMLAPLGCDTMRIGPVGDDAEALAEALKDADNADVLITTGGASVGDHDLMKPALEAWGASIDFWRVAMKPGKPIMVATRGSQVIFGLPGNPVSAYVTAFLFALPLIRSSMGSAEPIAPKTRAIAGDTMPAVGARRELVRGIWDGESATPVGSQDSSALAALSLANCLIDRPARSPRLAVGEHVGILPLGCGPLA